MGEVLLQIVPENVFGLNDPSNYHYTNSGMKPAYVLHKFNYGVARVDHGVHEYDCELSF